MATTAKRRTMRRTTRPGAAATPPPGDYQRTRAGVALAIFILVFAGLWVVNGDWTAGGCVLLFGVSNETGWAYHLVISAVELAAPMVRPYLRDAPPIVLAVIAAISLPFGVFDVLTSALGVGAVLGWTGAAGTAAHVQNTIVGGLAAFLPERMLLWLFVAMLRVLKGA